MLSIVIPSYRSGTTLSYQLRGLIEYLDRERVEREIIVVDDGSRDSGQTQRVVEALGCRHIGYEENRGKGAAVRLGMLAAKGDCRIFTDADIPFEHRDLFHMYEALHGGQCDVVFGDRSFVGSTYFEHISARRRLASSLFSFIVASLFTSRMGDTQCGLKGFTRTAAEDLFSRSRVDGFAFDVEISFIAQRRGYRIHRIPVKLRSQEESTVSLLRHSGRMLWDLCRVRWYGMAGLYDSRPDR
jgi:dolichyl-phosphate beta-glucosyltransferase